MENTPHTQPLWVQAILYLFDVSVKQIVYQQLENQNIKGTVNVISKDSPAIDRVACLIDNGIRNYQNKKLLDQKNDIIFHVADQIKIGDAPLLTVKK